MPVVAAALSVLAFPAAAALSFGLSAIGRRLADSLREDRVSRKDLRWLAGQQANGESI